MFFQDPAMAEETRACEDAEARRFPGPRVESFLNSPAGVVLGIVLTILLVILVTELIEARYHTTELEEGLLHVTALSGTLLPLFYFFWYRPLKQQNARYLSSREEARELARRLMLAEEEERLKIARDLHDDFGQKLTSLQIQVAGLQASLANGGAVSPDSCQPIVEMVAALSTDLRSTLADLRPCVLEELGIVAALESFCEEIEERQPTIEVDFKNLGAGSRLPPREEIVLFRVCQEALTNVIKHSGASRAEVCLSCTPALASLTVKDNGVGLVHGKGAVAKEKFKGKYGLIGMRERVASVGGSILISNPSGGGTLIHVEVPGPTGGVV